MDAAHEKGKQTTLPCMNCTTPVSPEEAKIFAEVFVCPTCFKVAECLYNKGSADLRALLSMMKEAIRIALIEGRLQLSEQSLQDVSKTDLLRAIVDLQEKHDASRGRPGNRNPEHEPKGG